MTERASPFYPHLLAPLNLGFTQLKNRVLMSPVFSLSRAPLAASPRAPERRAAELAAGEAPVTCWSRAQARCTPHLA